MYLVFIQNPKFSDMQAVRSLLHQQPLSFLSGLCPPFQGLYNLAVESWIRLLWKELHEKEQREFWSEATHSVQELLKSSDTCL